MVGWPRTFAIVVGAWALARVAHANGPPPPPPHEPNACSPEAMSTTPDRCEACNAELVDADFCAVKHLPEGRERRCVHHGEFRTYEVWCARDAGPPPVSPPAPAVGPPPDRPLSERFSCAVGAAPSPIGAASGSLVLAALAAWARRRRRGATLAAIGVIAASAACEEEQLLEARTGVSEVTRFTRPLAARGIWIDRWTPVSGVVRAGAFRVRLPEGWGEEQPADHLRWWFAPRNGRERAVGLRVETSMGINGMAPESARALRGLLARPGAVTIEQLEPVRYLLPGTGRGSYYNRQQPISLVIERAEVRAMGAGRGLVVEGIYPAADLRLIGVVTDPESDVQVPDRFDELYLTWPEALSATHRPAIDQILRDLTIEPEPRSRSCGPTVIAEPGERCDLCCGQFHRRGDPANCLRVRGEDGFEERCRHHGCTHLCQPRDPARVAWNSASHRATGVPPKR
jgi:hypothetical protein